MISNTFKKNNISNDTIVKMMATAGFTSRITNITKISSGMLNVIYKIAMEGLKPLVLRVRLFKHTEYGQEFAAERFAYYLTQDANINIPKLYFVCTDDTIYGYPFAVFECIEGQMFDVILSDPNITQEYRFDLLKLLANSLNEIHKVKGPGFGTLTSIWFSSEQRRDFWKKLFYAEYERLLKIDNFLGNLFGNVIERWLDCIVNLPPYLSNPRLVHGDIHGRNIIVTDNNQISLIDWEASRFRIVPYDFAQIRYLNLRNDTKGWDFFLDSYIHTCKIDIDKKQLKEAIEICESFWRLRMGLFQLQFPSTQDNYFGYAKDHIAQIGDFIREKYK